MPGPSFVYLGDIPLFRALDDEQSERLAASAVRRRLERGTQFQIEGHKTPFLAVVVRGRAKAILLRPDGAEILLDVFRPGDFLGETNLCDRLASPHTIVVTRPSEFLLIPAARVSELVRDNGDFAMAVLERLTERLAESQQRLRDAIHERADGKVLGYFENLADRIGEETDEGWLIADRVSHQTVADTCGLARETVTRTVRKLRERGLLERVSEGWLLRFDDEPTS